MARVLMLLSATATPWLTLLLVTASAVAAVATTVRPAVARMPSRTARRPGLLCPFALRCWLIRFTVLLPCK